MNKYKFIYQVNDIYVYSTIELDDETLKQCVASQLKRINTYPERILLDVDEEKYIIGAPYFENPPKIERIRRVTGYLSGTLDRFNDAKRSEESDRVKHCFNVI